jgi:aspartate aminotransferase
MAEFMTSEVRIGRAARLDGIQISEILRIVAKASERKAAGHEVLVLAAGEPDFPTPDHVKLAGCRAIIENDTRYTALDGTPALKRAIRDKFRRDNGLDFDLSEISAGAGAKQLIYNLFMATLNEGDEVIVPVPCWTSYFDMVAIAGGRAVEARLSERDGFLLRPERLEALITPTTRWVMLNSPSNPTGAVYGPEDLRALAEVFARHPWVGVISDEIYEHIVFDGRPASSLAQLRPDLRERIVIVNGVSKAYSMTGWRLGYAAGPRDLIAAMAAVQSQSTSNPCSISQAAAVAALDGPQEAVAQRRAIFQARRDFVIGRLEAIEGLRCATPGGAFYAFVNCGGLLESPGARSAGIADDADLCHYFLEEWNIAVIPGRCFGAPGYFRLSFAASDAVLEGAMDRLAQGAGALRG